MIEKLKKWVPAARTAVEDVARGLGMRNLGAIAATVLTVATLSLIWLPNDTWAGTVPSAEQTVGTCHAYETDNERNSFSDVRPPVPCDLPHQTETVLVGQLTGELAESRTRMTPERRVMVMNDLCPQAQLRAYTGAGPRDEFWSLGTVLRLPTEDEWANGIRQYRCELVAKDPADPYRIAAMTGSLRGVFGNADGARYRRCWSDFAREVSCDQPHRSESVSSIASVPDWRFAGPPSAMSPDQISAFQAWAAPVCEPTVSEFLGRPVRETAYRAEAHLTEDGKVLRCGVAVPGDPMTGSLARTAAENAK